ncbi:beta-N-acetylhexosaminidase [Luteolibacter ambystomatis]|uniref:beta-N-acetylhexosaminidase n=1 Tax=Luteolibacter ambystomatis TaxID=2824561 RepID=A0A975G8S3_9BACT|nr:beta-N-acetylhexosaminidase [Luteolibacter ambystomatis]QUE50846.1 beta-N-acetylhexosaminidase [Luteolibacter ambystomatis]
MFRLPLSCLLILAGSATAELPLIPRPAKVVEKKGTFSMTDPGRVRIAPFNGSAMALQGLSAAAGRALSEAAQGQTPQIVVMRDKAAPKGEGYRLEVDERGALVSAADDAGLFYGSQSLAQLIAASGGEGVPFVSIEDTPRYGWRGYMLDEARHFSGEAAVKRLLDAMARYKLNRFHWHLTDSAGWRIEIKKYPKLTTIGARGNETDRSESAPVQFYTQEEIKRIVAYAKERQITIIPEIDMPGHADAAVLAYPELDGGGMVQNGNPQKWPHFTFNPAKKEVLTFLDDVLKEVGGLFSDAGMIHYGGDEVNFGWKKWPELPEVKELMARENLKDNAAVEGWFNRRMAKSVNDLGFKTAGWDEIAVQGLPKDKTVVFWWRHDKPAVLRQALEAGYPVVMCPRRPCYFDFIQDGSHKDGRVWGGFNPISDVYQFPASLKLSEKDEKQVLGIQACLWTETMKTQARRDTMTWPRLIALGEAGWTPADRKDFASFETRLPAELKWLRAHGIQTWDPFAKTPEVSDKGAKVEYPDKPE